MEQLDETLLDSHWPATTGLMTAMGGGVRGLEKEVATKIAEQDDSMTKF